MMYMYCIAFVTTWRTAVLSNIYKFNVNNKICKYILSVIFLSENEFLRATSHHIPSNDQV